MLEEDLINLAKDGDMAAFEQIVRAYEKNVYNIALRMSGNPEDAFDLSQEIFLRLYRTLASFKGNCSFSTWLFRVANNICIDFSRKKSKRLKREQMLSHYDDESFVEIPDSRYNPETIYDKLEMRETLEKAMHSLSPEHRQVLVLRESGQLSYSKIAEILSLEEGTVKSRISRARDRLRQILINGGNTPKKTSSNKREGGNLNA